MFSQYRLDFSRHFQKGPQKWYPGSRGLKIIKINLWNQGTKLAIWPS